MTSAFPGHHAHSSSVPILYRRVVELSSVPNGHSVSSLDHLSLSPFVQPVDTPHAWHFSTLTRTEDRFYRWLLDWDEAEGRLVVGGVVQRGERMVNTRLCRFMYNCTRVQPC